MRQAITENHPPPEKLELLLEGKLRGGELVNTLYHLEKCDQCFDRLPEQDPQEVMQRLLADDEDEEE